MLTGARLMTKFQVLTLVRYLVNDFVIYPFLFLQRLCFKSKVRKATKLSGDKRIKTAAEFLCYLSQVIGLFHWLTD